MKRSIQIGFIPSFASLAFVGPKLSKDPPKYAAPTKLALRDSQPAWVILAAEQLSEDRMSPRLGISSRMPLEINVVEFGERIALAKAVMHAIETNIAPATELHNLRVALEVGGGGRPGNAAPGRRSEPSVSEPPHIGSQLTAQLTATWGS